MFFFFLSPGYIVFFLLVSRLTIRQYRQIHRNFFMGEKLLYYKRRQEAKESGGRIWSIIVDGMSSHSTHIPIGANTREFTPPFNTHIEGCISHGGNETTLYWSFPNVMTGASFLIDVLYREFERCLQDGKPLPDKVYIQVSRQSLSYTSITHLLTNSSCFVGRWWFRKLSKSSVYGD